MVDYDRDVRAIVFAACRIAREEGWPTMTPELLLLGALHDDGVRAFWGREAAGEAATRLRLAIVERLERERPTGGAVLGESGWTIQAHAVIASAMHRASKRGYRRPDTVAPVAEDTRGPAWTGWNLRSVVRSVARLQIRAGAWVGRGDLLHALADAPIVGVQEALVALPRLFGPLDAEDPEVPAGDVTGTPPPAGVGRASVVLDDDARSTMPAVETVLTEELGMGRLRAAVAMFRVHFRGADRVVTMPWDEAQDAVARCRARAAEIAPHLGVRLVPA